MFSEVFVCPQGFYVSGPMFPLRDLCLWSHVPSTAVSLTETSWTETPWQRSPRQRPLWTETPFPWTETPPLDRDPSSGQRRLDRDPPRQRPLGQRPPDRDPARQRPSLPWTETLPPPDRDPPNRDPPDRDLLDLNPPPLDRDHPRQTPWTETPRQRPPDRDPVGQRPSLPWTETLPPPDRDPPNRDPPDRDLLDLNPPPLDRNSPGQIPPKTETLLDRDLPYPWTETPYPGQRPPSIR